MAALCLSRLDFADSAEPYYRRAGRLSRDDLHVRAYGLVRANRRLQAEAAHRQILEQWPEGPLETVGRPATRVDGLARARGEARYTQDLQLPGKNGPGFSHVAKDHGRRTRRTVKAVLAPAWVEFDGAAQVAQVRRTVTRKGKKTVEVVYVITSDADADAATLAAWIQEQLDRDCGEHR